MINTEVVLANKLGLHARASAKLVSTALRFQSQLTLGKNEKRINGKSIMAVMTLGARQGDTLYLEIDGPDAEAMNTALLKLIENKFGEHE
ncbi:MAG: phosphocarrier protein HPr [Legionellales bacterium RIFCSPHIGHO2_12_FULL_37_14]|nr:MAG: phosphocarrier protein HPr [Legionellales bacterium RIFCSPHIGHO2_12_FULL_37_14]